jgi:hypothetical protein
MHGSEVVSEVVKEGTTRNPSRASNPRRDSRFSVNGGRSRVHELIKVVPVFVIAAAPGHAGFRETFVVMISIAPLPARQASTSTSFLVS